MKKTAKGTKAAKAPKDLPATERASRRVKGGGGSVLVATPTVGAHRMNPTAPNVCITPGSGSPVPIPYPTGGTTPKTSGGTVGTKTA
jgi:hypothetical protein